MLSADRIRQAALEAGFTLAGFARAEKLNAGALRRWLERGMHASMGWMAERVEDRLDPTRLLLGAKTVVALACCVRTKGHAAPSPIALYARGRDYHATMLDRLRALRRALATLAPGVGTYILVDHGPALETVWAQQAGLGWIGKNGMLINRDHGSHVVLAEMLLDQEVDAWGEPHPDRCGSCAACIARCPTSAIVEPQVVDSRLCLSHQTIEDRGPFAPELKAHAAGIAFGCDHCQTVCPWNKPDHACDDSRFAPRPIASLSLAELASLDAKAFEELAQGTAVARARHSGVVRNALVALGAEKSPAAREVARLLADSPDEAVRDAARWALVEAS